MRPAPRRAGRPPPARARRSTGGAPHRRPGRDTVPRRSTDSRARPPHFRMGFGGYFGAVPGERRRRAAATERGSPQPSLPPEPDEWMRRFSTLPLMCQPGERGRYDTGSDVLGVLIAPASGRSFGAFLRERVFEPPAGDTDFSVPPGRPVRVGRRARHHLAERSHRAAGHDPDDETRRRARLGRPTSRSTSSPGPPLSTTDGAFGIVGGSMPGDQRGDAADRIFGGGDRMGGSRGPSDRRCLRADRELGR